MNLKRDAMLSLAAALLALTGCTPGQEPPAPAPAQATAKITNRIDVPEAVRENLGISFVQVERRHIARTLRVPGRFELAPEALAEHHAVLAGRVKLHVRHLQTVEAGALLYSLEAPAWRELQQALAQAQAAYTAAQFRGASHKGAVEQAGREKELAQSRLSALDAVIEAGVAQSLELENARALWARRVDDLEKLVAAGTGKAADLVEARARLSEARVRQLEEARARAGLALQRKELEGEAARHGSDQTRLMLEEQALQAEMQAAQLHFGLKLREAVSFTGLTASELEAMEGSAPRWQNISRLAFSARGPGVVQALGVSDGSWAEQGQLVLTLADLAQVRVVARAMQADLLDIVGGQEAKILPPTGGALALATPLQGKVRVGLDGDADERVINLFVTPAHGIRWARPGVAVEVEIQLESTLAPVLAVPLSCVVRDELDRVIFRRDPNNPDKVIRIAGKFGLSDGRWIEIREAVMEGDEVVLGGVYELKLTGSGKATGAGHFHADGTWHAGADH